MKSITRILAGAVVITCAFSTTSCSGVKKSKVKKEQAIENAQEIMEKSYKAIEIETNCPVKEIYAMTPIGNTGKILINGSAGNNKFVSYITDKNFSTFTEIKLNIPEGDNIDSSYSTTVANNGIIFALASIYDYGDFELPDFDSPDFNYDNFDFNAMYEAAVDKYVLYTVDTEGKVVSETELPVLEKYLKKEGIGEAPYISNCFPIGDDKICIPIGYMGDMTNFIVDKDGNISENVDIGENEYFYPYSLTSDGRLAYIADDSDGACIKFIDDETMSVSPDVIELGDGENYEQLIKGTGDYILYLKSHEGLSGLKADGTVDELVDWVSSDLMGDYIYGVISDENNEFIIFEKNWEMGISKFYRLTNRDVSEVEDVQIINMVVFYGDTAILNAVKEFNKSNSEYRINVEDYSQYNVLDEETLTESNTAEKQLKKDLAEGKQFDILCLGGGNTLFTNLSNKGALADMYQFLDNDSDISRDDILPIIFEAGEHDGELTSLSPSFHIDTLACKTKYCDKESWTIADLIETYNNLPEGMKLFSGENTKTSALFMLVYGAADYIDFENATCNFDSPEFIQILEFCNQFDNEGEGDSIDWDNATNEEMGEYWKESETALRNDKALLGIVYFNSLREYARAMRYEFGEDITFVGFPSENGTSTKMSAANSFAIMKNSDSQEACWNFIKLFFTEEYQESENMYQIPALKSSFAKKLDATMENPYYIDENGEKTEYEDVAHFGDEQVIIPNLTQAERDKLEQFILNTKTNRHYYSSDINEIINEEVELYFHGDKTAQETAENIQNRVSILISEQA